MFPKNFADFCIIQTILFYFFYTAPHRTKPHHPSIPRNAAINMMLARCCYWLNMCELVPMPKRGRWCFSNAAHIIIYVMWFDKAIHVKMDKCKKRANLNTKCRVFVAYHSPLPLLWNGTRINHATWSFSISFWS